MVVKEIVSYTIPMYGNRRRFPYGKMRIVHDGKEYVARFGNFDLKGRAYITLHRKRYYFRNAGNLYSPKFEFYEP